MSDFLLLRFDSDELAAADRYPTYASAMVNFDVARLDEQPFRAVARVWRVGALAITHVRRVSPLRYTRDAARIAGDSADHFYINYHNAGWVRVDTERGTARGGAGSVLAIDMRQPSLFEAESRDEISIAIPRRLLEPRLKGRDPHGLIASGGMVPLLGRMLAGIVASLDALDLGHAAAIERMTADLVAETLLDALQSAESRRPGDEAVIGRACAFMDRHLAEPINVALICAGIGVSRSRLYRAFDDRGGVLRQLQQRRLRRMRAYLEDRAEMRSIAELAVLCGFTDRAHFARSFKREYGVTPGAFRAERQHQAARPAAGRSEAARLFGDMVREID